MRFEGFTDKWEKKFLSAYMNVSPARNKNNLYTRTDVLSVSGDLGCVNQIELLGRSFAGESLIPYHIVELNDIVYTKSPLSENPYGIIKTNRYKTGIVSTLYAVYKAKETVDNRFIEHYFSLKSRVNNYLKPIVRIGAKHDMKIGNEEVLNNYVIFPNKKEQQKISDFIDLLDSRIRTQSKIIKDLETQMKAIRICLLSNINTFARLSDLCFISTGKLDANCMNENGKYPFFTCGKETLKIDDYAFDCEAILISGNGDIGHTKYYVGKFNAYQRTYVLHAFKGNAKYIKSAIDHVLPRKVLEETQSSAMPYIKMGTLSDLKVPVPSLALQNKIVDVLEVFQHKLNIEAQILEKLKEQKKYLLSNMFI